MGSMNKAILIGNLGRDAELRYTPSGAPVCTLNLATTDTWKGKDGERNEATEWHRVVLWGKTAESLSEYLTRGKCIVVEGKIQTRQYEKDGQKHYATEIRADRVTLLGGSAREDGAARTQASRSGASAPSGGGMAGTHVEDDMGGFVDDVPFAAVI